MFLFEHIEITYTKMFPKNIRFIYSRDSLNPKSVIIFPILQVVHIIHSRGDIYKGWFPLIPGDQYLCIFYRGNNSLYMT